MQLLSLAVYPPVNQQFVDINIYIVYIYVKTNHVMEKNETSWEIRAVHQHRYGKAVRNVDHVRTGKSPWSKAQGCRPPS